MQVNGPLRLLAVLFLAISQSIAISPRTHQQSKEVFQYDDTPRFLITPYYSSQRINSFFDHELPNGDKNSYLLKYTGKEEYDPDSRYCTVGVNCYDGHSGYDFDLQYKEVIAAASGTVEYAGRDGAQHNFGLGLYVMILHVVDGIQYRTYYGHLATLAVQPGEVVRAGDIIGNSGSSGDSTGPHLHFEVKFFDDGLWRLLDPFGWQGADPDPWSQNGNGHASWCMWLDGEWANVCDSNIPSRPIPAPNTGNELIIDDNIYNQEGFSKGFGGLWNNPCVGVESDGCTGWYQSWVGYGDHTYRGIADGNETIGNWAKWSLSDLPTYKAYYEVFVWIPDTYVDPETFTWQARYVVHSAADGTEYTATVDEHIGDGENYYPYNRWLSIGIYSLNNTSYIYTSDATGGEANNNHCPDGVNNWCRFTADAIRVVSTEKYYLPAVRTSSDWVPNIRVRNNGGGTAVVRTNYFNANGTYLSSAVSNPGFNSISTFTPPTNASTAVITSDQHISVVLYDNKLTERIDAYTGIPSAPTSTNTWIYASDEIFVPAYFNYYYGWSSTLYIQNAGSQNAILKIEFYNTNGSIGYIIPSYTIVPYGQAKFSYIGISFTSVRIYQQSSNQPLAVVVRHENSANKMSCAYEGISNGSTVGFIPALFKNYYSWISSYELQEVTGQSVTVYVDYYPSLTRKWITLQGWGHQEIYMGGGWRTIREIICGGQLPDWKR